MDEQERVASFLDAHDGAALATALEKYESRVESSGDPGSGGT